MNKIKKCLAIITSKIKAFSMIELVISLLVISLIFAALTPVISKRASQMVKVDNSMSIYSATECNKWFNENCQVCTKNSCLTCDKICASNQYKNVGTCECEECATRSAKCIECGAKNCTRCREGYALLDGKCSDSPCAEGSYGDGYGACKPCPVGKYCMDGLVYNKTQAQEERSSGSYNIPIDKYKREFVVVSLIGAGGAGGSGNFKMTSANKTETYNYECGEKTGTCSKVYSWACGPQVNPENGACGRVVGTCADSCCTNGTSPSTICTIFDGNGYDCRIIEKFESKTCTGTRVVSSQSYSSYGGGGGGSGAALPSSISIPQSLIDSAQGGSLKVVIGAGNSGNGAASSVAVVNSSSSALWSITANGGRKGENAAAGSVGTGGSGASNSNSCSAGAKGGAGGSNTSTTTTNVQGTQGAGASSGYGAGGKGGTVVVNVNGKQREIAPAYGANGYARVQYVQLTR